MQTKENYFLSQPHQPFFLLGILNAIIMMLVFALQYKGILSLHVTLLLFHSYSLIFLVFTNFFTGFLFTTFPRFNQTQVIAKKYYANIFHANTLASLLFLVGVFSSEALVLGAMIISLTAQIFIVLKLKNIYETGMAADKSDSFWILNANYFGLFGNFLFILSLFIPEILPVAITLSFYMYLIFLAFSVGQRMIPFFSHSFASKNENFVKIVFVLFVLKSIFASADIKSVQIIVDLLLAVYMFFEFKRWDLHPLQSPPILWVLHLALFWLPVSFFLSALSLSAEIFLDTSFFFLNVHLLAIGFLTTLLIGFGTRVTLGHSGQPPQADKLATKIFLSIQLVVLLRALYSMNIAFGWGLGFLFDISFTTWLLLFLIWGGRYFQVLVFGKKL
ncbi:NnrS family protein [Sulfurimonas sediminis]|uniref:NnrS family protein n=1 Tax=Sulfurimonas sediminis TaxID=2590020 RepID=A0A7M1AZJ1_9BACT|nr:NnrS family protein [Sulfurimonas sediminis]QOP42716.1 NnrS family protein [Sulfurimonas sediminis]